MKTASTLRILFAGLFISVAAAFNAQCTFSGLNSNYCTNSPSSTLTPGIPGGFFGGPGISGAVFNPSLAGAGTHTISYSGSCTQYSLSSAPFATLTTAGTPITLSDDQVSGGLPIGFPFTFFCNVYSTFYISSNGFITFSNNGLNGCCQGLAMPTNSLFDPDNLIAYAWTDLYPPQGGSITYTTIGSIPNRTLVVSFTGQYHYNLFNPVCCPITSQIQLTETSNRIEIHTTTKPLATNASSYPTTMGIQSVGGTTANVVPGRNATTTWTASNECYRWLPAPVCFVTQTTIVSPSTISIVGTASICNGATTTLTATGNITYSWNTSSNSASIVVAPTISTTYAVAATNSFGCFANSAITVTVDNTPTVTVVSTAANGGVCPGATVALSGAGATGYSWSGGISNGVAFPVAGQSTFVVTGTNACGTASALATVSIHPLPNVTGVVSQPTLCSGNPITLTGVGNATNYVWNGNLANGVTLFPSVNTTYTVVGTSAQSCTASALASVTVVTTPMAPPIASPPLICVGAIATLSSSGASNYSWIGQSGPFSSASSVTVAPTTTTTYTLTKSNSNCVNTQPVTVIVNPLPGVFAFVNPTVVCAGKPANLSAGGAASYTWTAPPSFSVVGSSPIVTPTISTMYTVTASDGTCVNQTTVFLPTNPNPTIGIAATSSAICQEQTASLTAGGALGYTWTAIGLASSSTATTIVESPTLSTLYTVIGENTFNCTSGNSQVVVVHLNPILIVSSNKPMVCAGAPANLTVTGANTYTWDNNAGGATTSVVIVNPQVTTIYSVTGTYSATGCSTVKTIPITVFLPTFAVNSPTSSCLGGTINLIASGAQSYTWNGNAPFSQISVSPPTATVYQVAATSVSAGVTCISTKSVQVSIYANPTVVAVPQRTLICKGEATNLMGTGAVSYQWSTGQTGSIVPVDPITNQTYTVLGTDQNGCIGTTSLSLKVSPCFGISEIHDLAPGLKIYPNPNTGAFTVQTDEAIDLDLINELGQVVRKIHLSTFNSHKVSVENLQQGIYFLKTEKGGVLLSEKIIIHR